MAEWVFHHTLNLLLAVMSLSVSARSHSPTSHIKGSTSPNDGSSGVTIAGFSIKVPGVSPGSRTDSPNALTGKAWQQQDAAYRDWFEHVYMSIAGEINLEVREDYLNARLDWIRAGSPAFRDGFDPRP